MSKFILLRRVLTHSILVLAAGAVAGFAAIFIYLTPKLPDVDTLRDIRLQTPLRIYSRDQKLIGEFGEKKRTPLDFEDIPPLFIQAFLAAEDDRFYEHHGVDIGGLLRAASQLIVSGEIQTGGSTITMQVAKNYFLTQERTFSRKFNEIFLAIKIERALTKEEILELYLNKIFLGNHAYGVEAAAGVYYDKHVGELTLAQMAMIAGLPKAPSAYNPLVNATRAKSRRDWILGRMLSLGYIDENAYKEARLSEISASYYGSKLQADAAYVSEMIRRDMIRRFGPDAYTEGYRAYTTIDSELQNSANEAVINGVSEYDKRHGYRGPEQKWALTTPLDREHWQRELRRVGSVGRWEPALVLTVEDKSVTCLMRDGTEIELQWEDGLSDARPYINEDSRGQAPETAADILTRGDVIRVAAEPGKRWQLSQLPAVQASLVSMDAETGAIVSLVGGYDYQHSSFNRVTQANRQPGSNFKPFVYAAALENGATAATVINDAPIVFDDQQLESTWRPTNDSGKFYGPTRLRKALYNSRNLVSIRLLRSTGIGKTIDYVTRFGFRESQLPRDLSLALGSLSATPLDVVTGYTVFANGGYRVKPFVLERIEDRDGNILYQAEHPVVCRPCEEEVTFGPDQIHVGDEPFFEEATNLEAILKEAEGPQHPNAERIVEERVAYIMDSILKDVIRYGTGRRARKLGRSDLAGKTGTTNGPTDAWFSGYGSGIATTAWVGFDDNQNLGKREYGGSVALPIWMEYMEDALKGKPEQHMKQPAGIATVRIDPDSGKLAAPGQSNAIFEIFRAENVPDSETVEGPSYSPGNGPADTSLEEIF
ncbi:penicillin-binding protein 1A [Litorivivens lipolytica]|uniref:Penicillin-binding protein 1A n=1 Tax=Litorivivens lipolytica TaxID=1524264 RepID=A0A7W4W5F2_9GAMM|nr:penicillin-binding protein 1A [Litorivivens lipolytica]MBB3047770.1 penicillin-binding protein 1A [Litorivivens lipolytica]